MTLGTVEYEVLSFDSMADMINELGFEEVFKLAQYAYQIQKASEARDAFLENHKDNRLVKHEARKKYLRDYMRKIRQIKSSI